MQRLTPLVIVLLTAALVACESPSPSGDETKANKAQGESQVPSTKTADEQQAADRKPASDEAEETDQPDSEPAAFSGEVKRGSILENDPRWAERYKQAEVDEDVAEALSEVDPGARVEIYLGVWCEDSMREVPRFWRALDVAGVVPFAVEHIGLDESFSAGDVSLDGLEIEAVPTFIVYRDGKEVGRIVEDAPENIETHLLALLTGEASGVISASR